LPSVSGLTSATSGSPTRISTKLESVRTSSDFPAATCTEAVRFGEIKESMRSAWAAPLSGGDIAAATEAANARVHAATSERIAR
jgi:hypothetical protein